MLRKSTAVMALVLLSACSGDPEPKEPDPSPSASATVAPPEMPEQANDFDPAGAAAFASYYVETLNHSAAGGDTNHLSRLSSVGCAGCNAYINLYGSAYEAGGFYRGINWTLADVEVEQSGNDVLVYATMTVGESEYKLSSSDVLRTSTPEQTDLRFTVHYTGSSWRIEELERLK